MPPDAPSTSAPSATFSPDARTLVWSAWAFLVWGAAGLLLGWLGTGFGQPARGILAALGALFLIVALRFAIRALSRKAEIYRLSRQRIDLEHGIFGKRFEAVELWRIKDVVLEQGLVDRLLGNGVLTIYSSDQVEPLLRLGPVRDAKSFYDQLRDAMAQARKDAGVVQMNS